MRRAARVDETQEEIVKALRSIGAQVVVIKEPVDLLVGYRGKTHLMECKTDRATDEGGKHGLTKQQAEFLAKWNGGPAWIVQSPSQAIRALVGEEAMK
jgi:hypothetical protein